MLAVAHISACDRQKRSIRWNTFPFDCQVDEDEFCATTERCGLIEQFQRILGYMCVALDYSDEFLIV